MKKSLFLLPLLALVMGACSPETNEEVNSGTSASVPGEVTTPNGGEGTPDAGGEGTPDAGGEGTPDAGEGTPDAGEGESGGETEETNKSITITPADATVNLGETLQYSATLSPDTFKGSVVWSVEYTDDPDEEVDHLTISNTGLLTAGKGSRVGENKYLVRATVGSVTATTKVTIKDINHGSKENPLTVEQAREVIDWHNQGDQTVAYVKGVVSENSKLENNKLTGWVTTGDIYDAMYLSNVTLKEGLNYGLEVNDLRGKEVVVASKLKYLNTPTCKRYDFYGGEIISAIDAVATKPATSMVMNTTEGEVSAIDPFKIDACLLPLPSTSEITWTVTPETDGVTVTNGLVEVTKDVKPTNADSPLTITASVAGTNISKTCKVSVIDSINYGKIDNPLTTAEADALIGKYNGKLAKDIYVKGVISQIEKITYGTDVGKYKGYITNSDNVEEFYFWALNLGEGQTPENMLYKNVILKGQGNIHSKKHQIKSPVIAKILPSAKAEGFTLDSNEAVLGPSQTKQLNVTFTPMGSEGTITWESSNPTMVSVDNGLIKVSETVTPGNVTITATLDGTSVTKTFNLTVTEEVLITQTYELDCSTIANGTKMENLNKAVKIGDVVTMYNKEKNDTIFNGEVLRLFTGSKIVFTAPTGKVITKIVFEGYHDGGDIKQFVDGMQLTYAGSNTKCSFTGEFNPGKNSYTVNHSGKLLKTTKISVTISDVPTSK